jgi:outer membrane murein-binding lipoprotein Lpp
MSTTPGYPSRPPYGEDPYGTQAGGPDPDRAPATMGDLKGLRRWLIVAAIWAVAASAIGLIALFGGGAQGDGKDVDASQVADLSRKVDALQGKVDKATADASDAAQTASQLSSGIDDASSTADDAKSAADKASSSIGDLQSQIDEIDQRLKILENDQQPPITGDDGQGDEQGRGF